MTNMHKISVELKKVGVIIDDIYELVNTKKNYFSAISVLLDLLQEDIEDIKIKEGIVRALAVKGAKEKITPVLISEYLRTPKELSVYRWAIGNTIYMTITNEDIDDVVSVVRNKENGKSRQMFVAALGKVNPERTEDVLIELLDDEDVIPHAIEALAKLKSKKAKQKIYLLTNHTKVLVRTEALKALKKINSH